MIIIAAVGAYLTIALTGGVWLLTEYIQAGALPISTKKFFIVILLYGPLVVLAYGLLEAAFEGTIMLLIRFAKYIYRRVFKGRSL
ncbi:MAG: hypothetical protein HOP21_06015 [Methylotenera sp.]|nr:hypothetical protein [Methylotenera sp.]